MKKYFSLLFICSLLTLSCQKNNGKKFIGKWNVIEMESGYSTLNINEEKNAFLYASGGNGFKTFSNGYYKIVGDSISLTSTNSTKIDGCFYILPYGQCSFPEMRVTKLNCTPSKKEFYEFLDNEIFYIKDDLLIKKPTANSNCPKQTLTKFAKEK